MKILKTFDLFESNTQILIKQITLIMKYSDSWIYYFRDFRGKDANNNYQFIEINTIMIRGNMDEHEIECSVIKYKETNMGYDTISDEYFDLNDFDIRTLNDIIYELSNKEIFEELLGKITEQNYSKVYKITKISGFEYLKEKYDLYPTYEEHIKKHNATKFNL